MSYMGVDVGVTGTKAVIFSIEGKVLARSYYDYGGEYKRSLREKGEVDPVCVLEGVKKVIRDCRAAGLKDRTKTIAVSVSGDDVFPADKNGRPISNVITAFDQRSFEHRYREVACERIGGADNMFDITGQRVDIDIPSLIRIIWMRDNISDLPKRVWKFLCWESYLNHYLTGRAVTDYSNAARFATFDIGARCWSRKILDAFDISVDSMPEAAPSGSIVGPVRGDVAEELNLPGDLIVVTGGFDQATAALGAGVIDEGIFSLGMGTVLASHWMTRSFETLATRDYVYCNHLLENAFLGLFWSINGCNIVNWFFDTIADKEKAFHKQNVYDHFNRDLNSYPSKLFCVPHFAGGLHPYDGPKSEGLFLGLDLSIDKKEVLKSIYEGIGFDLRLIYDDLLKKNNCRIAEIRAVGGGSRSEVWVQILANILNTEFLLLEVDEGGCLACAVLGAAAVGDFKDVKEAVANCVIVRKKIHPEDEKVPLFREKFELYKRIYPTINDFSNYLDMPSMRRAQGITRTDVANKSQQPNDLKKGGVHG